jgi:hypothetical protein
MKYFANPNRKIVRYEIMKLNQKLSFLKDLSDREQELINGGATVSISGSGTGFTSSGRTFSSTFDGIATKTIGKSFSYSGRGPFAISIATSIDDI